MGKIKKNKEEWFYMQFDFGIFKKPAFINTQKMESGRILAEDLDTLFSSIKETIINMYNRMKNKDDLKECPHQDECQFYRFEYCPSLPVPKEKKYCPLWKKGIEILLKNSGWLKEE